MLYSKDFHSETFFHSPSYNNYACGNGWGVINNKNIHLSGEGEWLKMSMYIFLEKCHLHTAIEISDSKDHAKIKLKSTYNI